MSVLTMERWRATRNGEVGGQRVAAFFFCAALLVVTILAVRFSRGQGPANNSFVPISVTVWALADLMTAFLLTAQFYVNGTKSYAVLAAAYGFSGLLSWPYLLAFPGVLLVSPLSLGQQQISAVLWSTWHVCFPILVTIGTLYDLASREPDDARKGAGPGVLLTILGTVAGAALVTALVELNVDALPLLVINGHFQPAFTHYIAPFVGTVNVAAIVVLASRMRRLTPLHLWLFSALFAACMDSLLNSTSPTRFSYTWYVGKGETIVTSCVVLVMLLCGISQLYRQLTDAARAKTVFLANMSHEIRTPMNAVIGITELVLESSLTEDQRDSLEIVNDSGTALLRIIDDILDFSKIDAGKLHVETVEFSFVKMVDAVAATLSAQAHARSLTFSVFVDPRLPHAVYGDAGRLRQILTNLVGNALKFTRSGSVSLCAELLEASEGACDIRFSVTDTGIGITAEQLAHIFQPFAQADASTTRLFGGSGLGLSICHQLVQLMGGELHVDSSPGIGSTFSFVLRLRAGAENEPVARSVERVLIIRPSGETTSELTRYLLAWGVAAKIVASSAVALASIETADRQGRAFDLVIVDADKPGVDAFTLGKSLATDPVSAGIRRILVATSDEAKRRGDASMAGFSACLVRPLRQMQLFDRVMNVPLVPASPRIESRIEQLGLRILLAEDNVVNQRVALRQLHKLGYDATVVATGRAALAEVMAGSYDVVFMDCSMPEMDGYAATRAIRRHESGTGRRTPIVAMTANAQAEDRATCLDCGMDDFLSKPVTLTSIGGMLERYCDNGARVAVAPVG